MTVPAKLLRSASSSCCCCVNLSKIHIWPYCFLMYSCWLPSAFWSTDFALLSLIRRIWHVISSVVSLPAALPGTSFFRKFPKCAVQFVSWAFHRLSSRFNALPTQALRQTWLPDVRSSSFSCPLCSSSRTMQGKSLLLAQTFTLSSKVSPWWQAGRANLLLSLAGACDLQKPNLSPLLLRPPSFQLPLLLLAISHMTPATLAFLLLLSHPVLGKPQPQG